MVEVGIVGIGFMGVTHYKALMQVKGGKTIAICSRNPRKLSGDWRGIRGNFGEDGGVQDLSAVKKYERIEDILKDDEVDLVDICLPTYMHKDATIAALRAGKHVLVEKPMALTVRDADTMVEASQSVKRLLMVGQVVRFSPAFAEAKSVVDSGKYGALVAAHFKRIISMPKWGLEDHFSDASKSGGPGIDLHIHDTDFVRYLAGTPVRVNATGVVASNQAVQYLQAHYIYEGGRPCISCQSGAIGTPGLLFEHGYDCYLERATLHYNNHATGDDIWVFTEEGKKKIVRPRRKPAFVAQLQHVVDCVAVGAASPLVSGESARASLYLCLKEQESVLKGKAVRVGL